ncbi:MAG: ATP-binding protein, partial [Pseudomonadota bacterium]
AVKFSPPRGEVRVGISAEDEHYVLSVSDDGPGIPEEFRPRLFQKFSQSDSSDTRIRGGTGLGLSICHAIVERHNGEIRVDCPPKGGTTVYVSLPASATDGDAEQQDLVSGCPMAKVQSL